MKPIFRSGFRARPSRIRRRLDTTTGTATSRPVSSDQLIRCDGPRRDRAIARGGIGAIPTPAHRLGRPQAVDQRRHRLPVHLPYHQSDHVPNLASNPFCNGTCLQDLERRRNGDAFLDALGACRVPDPTTAGDFGRRVTRSRLDARHDAIDVARRKVWAEQPASFLDRATPDMDGTPVEATGPARPAWTPPPTAPGATIRRRLVLRVLGWNRSRRTFFRPVSRLRE